MPRWLRGWNNSVTPEKTGRTAAWIFQEYACGELPQLLRDHNSYSNRSLRRTVGRIPPLR